MSKSEDAISYDDMQAAVSSYIDNHDRRQRPRLILVSDQDRPDLGPYIPIRMCKAPISKGTIIVY